VTHGHDPRAIANFILDVADEIARPASNLVLNKVAYFLHGDYLARTKQPLIDARIEAWNYGPVFREIYHEFKSYKDLPISGRARTINRVTGEKQICSYSDILASDLGFLREIAASYLKLRPGALVELSHAHDGPWHEIWFHDGRVNPGMEISNDIIERHFAAQGRH
jgi:uncharacterized phage-associated protein